MIGGQFVAVILAALAPFALIGGVLPGAGRPLLWRWGAACLRCVVVIVAMAGVLAVVLVLSTTVLAAPSDSLLERFGLLVILVAAGLLLRRKLLHAATAAVANLDRRLERRRTGGTHGGGVMRPAAAGGLSGFGIAHGAREGRDQVLAREVLAREEGRSLVRRPVVEDGDQVRVPQRGKRLELAAEALRASLLSLEDLEGDLSLLPRDVTGQKDVRLTALSERLHDLVAAEVRVSHQLQNSLVGVVTPAIDDEARIRADLAFACAFGFGAETMKRRDGRNPRLAADAADFPDETLRGDQAE